MTAEATAGREPGNRATMAALLAAGDKVPSGYDYLAFVVVDATMTDGYDVRWPGPSHVAVPRAETDAQPLPGDEFLVVRYSAAGSPELAWPGDNALIVAVRDADTIERNDRRARVRRALVTGRASISERVFANGQGHDLSSLSLPGAKLTGAYLTGALLESAYLPRAALDHASMAGCHAPDINLTSAIMDNSTMNSATLDGAILRMSSMARVSADRASLAAADLRDAHLCGSSFRGADFTRAMITRADFSGCYLRGADFSGCEHGDNKWREAMADDTPQMREIIPAAQHGRVYWHDTGKGQP